MVGKAEYFRGVGRHGISEAFWSSDTLFRTVSRDLRNWHIYFFEKNLSI